MVERTGRRRVDLSRLPDVILIVEPAGHSRVALRLGLWPQRRPMRHHVIEIASGGTYEGIEAPFVKLAHTPHVLIHVLLRDEITQRRLVQHRGETIND